MATLESLKAAKQSLLLKPLNAVVFLAPHYTAPPESFTGADGITALPEGYKSVGLIAKADGVSFGRDVQTSEVESYGELEPTRVDIDSDVTTLDFTPQETSKLVLEVSNNTDLSAVTADASTGEVFFAQPTAPSVRYYSAIVIGQDGSNSDPIYIFKIMPKVAVTRYEGQKWAQSDVLSSKMTLNAFKSEDAGYAVAHAFGGSGWKKIAADAGFSGVTP